MLIRTLWAPSEGDDEMPWLVAAVDEYCIESCGGLPDMYKEQMKPEYREIVINIPEKAVRELFTPPLVIGKVE